MLIVEPVQCIFLPKRQKTSSSDHIYGCASASSASKGRPYITHAPKCNINRPPVHITDLEEEALCQEIVSEVRPPSPLPLLDPIDKVSIVSPFLMVKYQKM